MAEIIPSIIAKDFSELEKKIKQVEGLTTWVQLDVADGLFAPNKTWSEVSYLSEIDGKIKLEAHLMINEPEQFIEEWASYVDRIIIHHESTDFGPRLLETIDLKTRCQFGVALNLETPLTVLEAYGPKLKFVQLMSISELGFYGGKFSEQIFNKVSRLREERPDLIISVDGGISDLEKAEELIKAGANNLVIGSAIWESKNVPETIKKFQALVVN